MSRQTGVYSLESLELLRQTLIKYDQQLRDAIQEASSQRELAVRWVEDRQSAYWPAQARLAADRLLQAKNDLQRCQSAPRPEDRRSCLVEQKVVERAKARLRLCEEKVRIARQTRVDVEQSAEQLETRLVTLQDFLERNLPQAIARLDRMIDAIQQYGQVAGGELPPKQTTQPPVASTAVPGSSASEKPPNK